MRGLVVLNILIPMAGSGSRFKEAGYIKPKPFIDVAGEPMIARVLENLKVAGAHYILVARREHIDAEADLVQRIKRDYQATFVEVDGLTEGTACSVLHARNLINNEIPLLIANSDQLIDFSCQEFFDDLISRNLDGSIVTFIDKELDPKWSFARVVDGFVKEVREKNAISEFATAGVYLFRCGADFVDAAIEMILQQDRINNEYYTCPTYNYLIQKKKKIGTYNISQASMHGIGTPNDLKRFLDFYSNKN